MDKVCELVPNLCVYIDTHSGNHTTTEIINIVVSQDYENFAESTKCTVAPTLACSNYSVGQARVEQPYIKCF